MHDSLSDSSYRAMLLQRSFFTGSFFLVGQLNPLLKSIDNKGSFRNGYHLVYFLLECFINEFPLCILLYRPGNAVNLL